MNWWTLVKSRFVCPLPPKATPNPLVSLERDVNKMHKAVRLGWPFSLHHARHGRSEVR